MAFTAVARGGFFQFSSILSHGTNDFRPLVHAQVDPTAIIATELPAYIAIRPQGGGHIKVNHSAGEIVRTDKRTGLKAHVNTAESVHAMFERAIIGVWHQISGKHMHRYLGEIESSAGTIADHSRAGLPRCSAPSRDRCHSRHCSREKEARPVAR